MMGTDGGGSSPAAPDGQFNDQGMPTSDGEMASNGSEEIIPPEADSPEPDPLEPAPSHD